MSQSEQVSQGTKTRPASNLDQSKIAEDIATAEWEKQEHENQILICNNKIKDLNIDLKHMKCVQKLLNGKIVNVMNETDFFLSKYHVQKIRIWNESDPNVILVVDLNNKEFIRYDANGKHILPWEWQKNWIGWNMQIMD